MKTKTGLALGSALASHLERDGLCRKRRPSRRSPRPRRVATAVEEAPEPPPPPPPAPTIADAITKRQADLRDPAAL